MAVPVTPDDARPVPDPVREEILDPFIRGVTTALAEMAAVDVAVRSVYQTSAFRTPDGVAAVVELASTTPKWFILSFPKPTALALAGQVLHGVSEEDRQKLIGDFAGELANVAAGQAKTALAATPHRFTCSLPTVLDGPADLPIPEHCATGLVVVFEVLPGELGMRLIIAS
jgi:CheY-specific phosphatase CheX